MATPADSSNLNEKRRKRLLSNRESARRSCARKLKQLEDLSNEETALQEEIGELPEKIRVGEEQLTELEHSNAALRARMEELNSRIKSLDTVLRSAGHGVQTSDPLMQPWLPPFATAYAPDI